MTVAWDLLQQHMARQMTAPKQAAVPCSNAPQAYRLTVTFTISGDLAGVSPLLPVGGRPTLAPQQLPTCPCRAAEAPDCLGELARIQCADDVIKPQRCAVARCAVAGGGGADTVLTISHFEGL